MVFSPLISILHSNTTPRKFTKNIRKMYKNHTNQTSFSVNHPNHINTSKLIFQYLLGNKPWFIPHLKALKNKGLRGFRDGGSVKNRGQRQEQMPQNRKEYRNFRNNLSGLTVSRSPEICQIFLRLPYGRNSEAQRSRGRCGM